MPKLCDKCKVTYAKTNQTKCSYCGKQLKTVFSQGMCPNTSLAILQADMAEHTNVYFGVH